MHWDSRTPLQIDAPKLFLLYQDLNDQKLRGFLAKQNGLVLDVGCGSGRFMDFSDIGVDFSLGMLKRAKKKHILKDFIRASALSLPFKDGIFSISYSVDMLLHITNNMREKAVNELNRVSKKSYIFLAEDRTVTPFIFQILSKNWLLSKFSFYISLILAFPFDRLRKLRVCSTRNILKKLG